MTEYGARLFPQHQALLRASAISVEVADERGYVSVDTKKRLEDLEFTKAARSVPGLLIPIHNTSGTVLLHQYRPDVPRVDGRGRERKYETPWQARMRIDVPPRVLDRLGDPAEALWVTEGSRKADAAVTAGLCCVALLGVSNWRGTNGQGGKTALPDWNDIALNNRVVYVAYDSDVMVKESVRSALKGLTAYLALKGADVRWVFLPAGDNGAKTGFDDYLANGGTVDGLYELARDPTDRRAGEPPKPPPLPPPAPSTLAATVATFKRWLYLDDPTPLYVLAAALVANRAPGDPVWLLLVCAPSTGKTEMLSAAMRLPWVIPAAKVTESALLSGTSAKDKARDATGGLLRQVGEFGVILAKDFTSVLAQNSDTRAEALAALREVYDGRWDRPVGTDGGRMLIWQGKCGLIGGVTPALDRYAQVVATLGDRFVLLRMPDADVSEFGKAALAHGEHETQMRHELRESLAGLVEHADTGKVNRPLQDWERDWIIKLAAYTARARTGVDRDGYRREILYLPQVEGPGRLVKAYARLLGALEAIGCDQATTRESLTRVAIDSVPALRTSIIRDLLGRTQPAKTAEVAAAVDVISDTAKMHLEDLSLLRLAEHARAGDADNAAYVWWATPWLREHWPSSDEKYVRSPTPYVSSREGDPQEAAFEGSREDVHPPSYFSSEHAESAAAPQWDWS